MFQRFLAFTAIRAADGPTSDIAPTIFGSRLKLVAPRALFAVVRQELKTKPVTARLQRIANTATSARFDLT